MMRERLDPTPPLVQPRTGTLVKRLYFAKALTAEIYADCTSLGLTQYPFVMVVKSPERIIGFIAAEVSPFLRHDIEGSGNGAASPPSAFLISYHSSIPVNHGDSPAFATLDGFSRAAAFRALDFLYGEESKELYCIDSKVPAEENVGIPAEYFLSGNAYATSSDGTQQAKTAAEDEKLKRSKVAETVIILTAAWLSAGRSDASTVKELVDLGMSKELAKTVLREAREIIAHRGRGKSVDTNPF